MLKMIRPRRVLLIAATALVVVSMTGTSSKAQSPANVGLVDTATGQWYLNSDAGSLAPFYFGDPGDIPMVGDWDCDGTDTPGLYRSSDGFVYLRNSNDAGIADISFFFGDPNDVPLAGDFNGNGCDTVSLYRPSQSRVFVINHLGTNGSGLGPADYDYTFGDPGDKPFVADFNGTGVDTIGMHRESTGLIYLRLTNTSGVADQQFTFGDPGDLLVAGDWTGQGFDTPAVFRPSQSRFYFIDQNATGPASRQLSFGGVVGTPVSGHFAAGSGGITKSTGRWVPPPGTTWQWQLTGNIDQSFDVAVYDIDGFDASASEVASLHASGRKVICYISAGSWEDWRPDAGDFPASVKGNNNGWPGEKWLDIRNLAVLGPIMEARLDMCVNKGFDAVEPDNIDGYTNNTGFPLSAAHQRTYNRFLADAAHARGLSIGLKNDIDQVVALEPWFDFAINEQCFQYNECDTLLPFIDANKAVFEVEYNGALDSFCPDANAMGFSSMKKRLDLDAWMNPCW